MFRDRNETMMMEHARTVRRSVMPTRRPEKEKEKERKPLLWNEAQLNFVSLRSQLDYEVTIEPLC
jgi:hypothetical protein